MQRQGKPASATISDLCGDPDLRSAVQDAIDRANTAVSRAERIKRFRILAVTYAVGAELTHPKGPQGLRAGHLRQRRASPLSLTQALAAAHAQGEDHVAAVEWQVRGSRTSSMPVPSRPVRSQPSPRISMARCACPSRRPVTRSGR